MHKVFWTHHPKTTDFHIIWGYFLLNSWDASWFSGSFQTCMWNYLNHKRKIAWIMRTPFFGGVYAPQKAEQTPWIWCGSGSTFETYIDVISYNNLQQQWVYLRFQAFESNPTQQPCCWATRQIQAVKNAIDSYRHSPPGVKPSEWTSLMVILYLKTIIPGGGCICFFKWWSWTNLVRWSNMTNYFVIHHGVEQTNTNY